YADPAKVKVVHHEGKYYKCHGRHFCAPSPQGRPVLWQAGSSNQGRDFAAKHAEAIFAVHPNVDRMKQYADDLNTRMATKFNREPGSVKLIYGLGRAFPPKARWRGSRPLRPRLLQIFAG